MNAKRKRLYHGENTMNRHGKLLAAVLLAACSGGGLSGTYAGGIGSITFASGKADVKLMGATREMSYRVDGNKVVLHAATGADIVLTRGDDGSLDTPWGHMRRAGAASVSHTYRSQDGSATVTFAAGKMTMTTAGQNQATFSAPYTVSGNRITVHGPGGQSLSFTRAPDGSLTSPGSQRKLIPVN